MWQHFEAGGEIDHVVERRAEFAAQNEFHYDFRFAVDDVDVYLETILRVTLTGPEITVVSMHRQ